MGFVKTDGDDAFGFVVAGVGDGVGIQRTAADGRDYAGLFAGEVFASVWVQVVEFVSAKIRGRKGRHVLSHMGVDGLHVLDDEVIWLGDNFEELAV